MSEDHRPTFSSIGVCDEICNTLDELGWSKPTPIQCEALPHAFAGRDIIGLAETGSGKTGAFSIPIIQALIKDPSPYFALILTPTRELALQIFDQIRSLGKEHGVRVICLVGGVNQREQMSMLKKTKYHIVIATPGRLMDHLANTVAFHLNRIRFLVLDEADRILKLDDESVGKILEQLPEKRTTFLFSATMTKKVGKLQRASLRNPLLVRVGGDQLTVESLRQHFVLVPHSMKDAFLVHLASKRFFGKSIIVFTSTWKDSIRLALLLRQFDVPSLPLNGHMPQRKRVASLAKFRAGDASCLLATDLASRGLDIPAVDLVINYSTPTSVKDYVHRVGRTARAGRAGMAISLVTQYNVDRFREVEAGLGEEMEAMPGMDAKLAVKGMLEKVEEMLRAIRRTLKEQSREENSTKKRNRWSGFGEDEVDDGELLTGMRATRRKRRRKGASAGGADAE